MAKGKCVETKTLEGLGVINLEHPEKYRPWIHSRELTSGSGKRHVFPDIYHPERMIHLMSNLEKEVYFMLRGNEKVVELFEQVCLELEETSRICEQMHYIHPRKPFSNELNIMTTDFVVYVETEKGMEFRAYAVKPAKDLEDVRVIEKLKIEQLYWERKHIRWEIITECNI